VSRLNQTIDYINSNKMAALQHHSVEKLEMIRTARQRLHIGVVCGVVTM
jgi:hypothetical protein